MSLTRCFKCSVSNAHRYTAMSNQEMSITDTHISKRICLNRNWCASSVDLFESMGLSIRQTTMITITLIRLDVSMCASTEKYPNTRRDTFRDKENIHLRRARSLYFVVMAAATTTVMLVSTGGDGDGVNGPNCFFFEKNAFNVIALYLSRSLVHNTRAYHTMTTNVASRVSRNSRIARCSIPYFDFFLGDTIDTAVCSVLLYPTRNNREPQSLPFSRFDNH